MEIKKPETKTEERLIGILKDKIMDDAQYINGVICLLETDDERQDMIDEITEGNVVTSDDVILFALQIDEERGQNDV